MKRLRKLRLEKGLTQQQLADALHISQQSIHKYEAGLCFPTVEGLKEIACFFDTTADYMIELSDLPHPAEPPKTMELSEDENRLLSYYRLLEPMTKELIQRIINEKKKKSDPCLNNPVQIEANQ